MYVNVAFNVKTAVLVGIIGGLIYALSEKNNVVTALEKENKELKRMKGE